MARESGGTWIEESGRMERLDAVIVGGGQAGLAASHELSAAGIEHVLLERGRIGETWRRLWDSFCLVTPNWSVRLPGYPYDGSDPDGFMVRDEIVAYLERYAHHCGAPVREGVSVESMRLVNGDGFLLETSSGALRTAALVLATGAFQRAHRPRQRGDASRRSPADGHSGLSQSGGVASGEGACCRQRPVGCAARRRASPGRARCLAVVRPGGVGPASARRARHRVVAH